MTDPATHFRVAMADLASDRIVTILNAMKATREREDGAGPQELLAGVCLAVLALLATAPRDVPWPKELGWLRVVAEETVRMIERSGER